MIAAPGRPYGCVRNHPHPQHPVIRNHLLLHRRVKSATERPVYASRRPLGGTATAAPGARFEGMGRSHDVRPILIVDDDPFIRDVVQAILESEGYPVATAEDGAVALRLVAASRPGLVLLDVDMPVVDGPTFARAYRAMEGP